MKITILLILILSIFLISGCDNSNEKITIAVVEPPIQEEIVEDVIIEIEDKETKEDVVEECKKYGNETFLYLLNGKKKYYIQFDIECDIYSKEEKDLTKIVDSIKEITDNTDDQARVIISLVQSIDFGDFGEKRELMYLLLEELGYGVAYYSEDNIGIKCPVKYSTSNSGYCIIYTRQPEIITYSPEEEYVSRLKSINGLSFDSVRTEWSDAKFYRVLFLSPISDSQKTRLIEFKMKYNLKIEMASSRFIKKGNEANFEWLLVGMERTPTRNYD